ncbi:hypothetical protein Indivirus_9_12 [Indivirus ILV1]|uniref:Uncharacterized protein n=1 Tax=Indivirus ILV1 TaxID=1977633 RepID=A0A1V0SE86_9VIRU|nr:hypothetical protein Indivirus_9_12 [Indivirus ILV1]
MNRNIWKNNIQNLNIYDNLKSNLISFFDNFGHIDSFSFIQISDEKIINAFGNINNYRPLSICFDIEFQGAIVGNMKNITSEDGKAIFIREIGLMFFIHDKKHVYYIGHIFLNFDSLDKIGKFNKKDMRLITAKYATVSNETYELMADYENDFHIDNIFDIDINISNNKLTIQNLSKELYENYLFKKKLDQKSKDKIKRSISYLIDAETNDQIQNEINYIKKILNNIQYDIYAKDLEGSKLLTNFNKVNNLYWNDELVKNRLKLIEGKYDDFMKLFSELSRDSILIVKGKMDLVAVKNTKMIINKKINMDLDRYYDIETFNGFSRTHFGSSQLENTYRGLINTKVYDKSIKTLFDEIGKSIGEKAHNPVADSLFTIVVAIVINVGLNERFEKELSGGSKIKYHKEYLKYKERYLTIKHNEYY